MTESHARRYAPFYLLGIGLVLFFPGLSSFGFWDPNEVRPADLARAMTVHGSWMQIATIGHPPAATWLTAVGFKLIGVSELGGRLPIAFTALLGLFACYYAGTAVLRARAALFGTIALATTPLYLLGARQLITAAPLYLAASLAVGGLARAAWPKPEEAVGARIIHLLIGALGLAIGQASGGIVVGVIAPLVSVTAAVAIAGGAMGAALVGGVAATAGIVAAVWAYRHTTGFSSTLGGVPRPISSATVVTGTLKQLGAALFPWIAVFPFGAAEALSGTARTVDEDAAPRVEYSRLVLVLWGIVTYSAATMSSALGADTLAPLGPPLLLLAGSYLDDLLDAEEARPFAGLAIALGVIVLGRDFFTFPESFAGAHTLEPVRWPGTLLVLPYLFVGYACVFGALAGATVGMPLRAATDGDGRRAGRELVAMATFGAALLMALVTIFYAVPEMSKQLSPRDLYGKTTALDPNAPLGQYRFNASAGAFYSAGRTPVNLPTAKDVFDFLRKPERVFVMVGTEELAALDQTARETKSQYVVVDDANSRFLLLSNRLGAKEQDLNPLRRFITESAPSPQHPVAVDFDGKISLLGYDLPATLDRGTDFKIRLYFKVEKPVGGNYKVFLHFDGPGTRVNGDHVPVEGRFPTQHWVPGYYIIDEHLMKPDRATQPAGAYKIYMGLYSGEQRMKVLSGPQDGDQRVFLGAIQFK